MGKNLLHKQITSASQDKVIGIIVVGLIAVFVAYAIQSATESTIAAIEHTIHTATVMQSF